MVGKWHLGFFRPEFLPTSRGFETFVGYYGGEEDYFTKEYEEGGYTGYDLRNGTDVMVNLEYSTHIYRDESLRIMKKHVEEKPEDPFFLYLPFQAPHAPFQAPDDVLNDVSEDITTDNRRGLAAAMTVLDDAIGQIVDYLKSEESGYLWDDTVIVISSDNGGDVDYYASNYPLRGTKGTLFEGGIKAIGIVNGGWLNDDVRGTQMNALMHSTDWFVTLQSIAGIEPSVGYELDGLDQMDNLLNGNGPDIYSPRETLLHNAHDVAGAVRWRDYKLMRPSDLTNASETDTGLTKKCHSLWCIAGTNTFDDEGLTPTISCWQEEEVHPKITADGCAYSAEFCLFNIRKDPCEFNNVREDEATIFDFMVKMYAEYQELQAPALFDLYPEDYEAASPDQFSGVWSPWMGLDQSEDEVLAVEESVVTQSQRFGVLQHLLGPSIGFLLVVVVLVVLLQATTRFIRRNQRKNGLKSSWDTTYGAL